MKITVKVSSTLMEFLADQYPDSPRTRIKKLLQAGTIRVNDKPVTLYSYPLKQGDIVEVNRQAGNAARAGLPFPVLYEDQFVIVIDKPPGRPTSSTDGSLSIQEILSEYLKSRSKGKVRSHVVHRLDKEVSGVLLFAKTREAMETIQEKWKATEKHYYALVEGIPEKEEDTISSWLIEDGSQKVHSTKNSDNARFAVTNYKVIRIINDHALLDIRTDTGRKNQIRVHLSDIGCPIIGDRKYGASAEFKRRVRLHAYSLAFPHPAEDRIIKVKSPMPEGFLSLKAKDEHYK
ncbi:MAG: RluA family pseudouridine synthase [Bacteroidia bacterium]|nr:MAG: RluA family pseudouridine synthase [Bacteroidia bacterium]